MNAPGPDRAESIRHRLRNVLRARGEDVQFGLQRYAAERFLYRLGESAHRDRFILKGAALFALWGGAIYRPTRDLDFAAYGSPDAGDVLAALRGICEGPVSGEVLEFDAATLTPEPIRDGSEYRGLRVRLRARLGASRIPVQIDMGFGNAISPPPQMEEYPTLLDDPAPRIKAYPVEAVVAEKLHAMILLGERNTRFKDFYDLQVLAGRFPFVGRTLAGSVSATFDRRGMSLGALRSAVLSPAFFTDPDRGGQWRAYVSRHGLPGAPADFAEVGRTLISFLGPVANALAARQVFALDWPAGGPWRGATTNAVAGPPVSAARSFRVYPSFKDSGVEWLGEIPAHWKVRRLKHIARLNPEQLSEDTDPALEVVYVDIGGVDGLGRVIEREALTFAEAPSRARRVVRAGDVIVSTVRTYLRAIAAIRQPESGIIVSTGFAVIRPAEGLTTDYAAYALRAPYFVERVVANSNGVSFPAINETEMATFELARPPAAEQRAIAAFLDRETARIDALVARKERLIELLQERRTALIARAVTKGLDPNVPMKDSGVDWLGQIPARWELVPSTWLFTESKERALNGDEQLSATQSYGVIPQVEFERLEGRQVVHAFMHLDQRKHVEVDNFVMSMRSFEGGLERVRTRGCVRSSYVVLRSSAEVHVGFFSRLFKSSAYVQALRATSNFIRDGQDLNYENFRLVKLPLVHLREQEAIAAFLDRETSKIDTLVAKVRDAIQHLKELRTTLISAAVTGRIDVRGEAP